VRRESWLRLLALAHGAFYVAARLWPVVSMATFERVTGPKTDDWLVQTVGLLIAVTGVVILDARRRGRFPRAVVVLAVGDALALAAVDVVFVAGGRIPPTYLTDAPVELALAAAWLVLARPPRGSAGR